MGSQGRVDSQELISQVGIRFCAQHCNWGEGGANVQAFHWSAHTFIMILGRLVCTCEISSDNRPKTISKSRVILYSIPPRMPSTLRRQGSGLGRLSERLSEVAVCEKSRTKHAQKRRCASCVIECELKRAAILQAIVIASSLTLRFQII